MVKNGGKSEVVEPWAQTKNRRRRTTNVEGQVPDDIVGVLNENFSSTGGVLKSRLRRIFSPRSICKVFEYPSRSTKFIFHPW